ncbi:MAG: universal stress protein [Roseovarius sp.]|jgi:nucleotide-binding universal stress UspA family protein|uniref:universal stress protein n=1 Tax=Roseovarius sp. TaxID=1486281 RepID=UPI001B6AC0FC|nr:universal stress protein [Roseovarius sp.]MBQ0751744.1 universal stress protein [Roseovarius sp.]MBQ0809465.1 universal stress protein [Roseovarius sp.]
MAKTILLPIDMNNAESAMKPLSEALTLLGDGGVLHVVSVLPSFGFAQITAQLRKDYEKNMLVELGRHLGAWVSQHVPKTIDVHPHVLHGTIYDEILRAAEKLDVDLIVMGAHRPDLTDYLLGPNAARVVRHFKKSVYVVRS